MTAPRTARRRADRDTKFWEGFTEENYRGPERVALVGSDDTAAGYFAETAMTGALVGWAEPPSCSSVTAIALSSEAFSA